MQPAQRDEWSVIESLLPAGWKEAAREKQAFRRARYTMDPAPLLRVLLFHAVNNGGLRETVAQARASGIVSMSQVALLKRLRTSSEWLAWLGLQLCNQFREQPRLPAGLRPRAIDSTTVQGPASKGTEWRVHYALDLLTLSCDWFELTDAHGAELLERTPFRAGDVILADRNYLRPAGVRAAVKAGAHVLIRLRWTHCAMVGEDGKAFKALNHARKVKVGKVGQWPVQLLDSKQKAIAGRVVVAKLPAPLAAQAERRTLKKSQKKCKNPDKRSLEAAHFVMLFTTLPEELLGKAEVMKFYRYRWQIELAFKRLKQLLQFGHLPHQDGDAARGWIHAKLVVAMLLETLFRNARNFSPWGHEIPLPTQLKNAA
jgi:hypothetical protein